MLLACRCEALLVCSSVPKTYTNYQYMVIMVVLLHMCKLSVPDIVLQLHFDDLRLCANLACGHMALV